MKNVYFNATWLIIVIVFCMALQPVFGQNGVAIAGGSSATADNSAMLDVQSTSKGVLIPRMSSTQRLAITNPANGLLVYDNSLNYYYYYTGGPTGNIAADWVILNTGGVGTTGGTQYYIPVWNTSNGLTNSIIYDSTTLGVGIGTASPAALIDINANGALITAATAAGGNVNITAQNAGGSNQNGGNIVLTAGTATGTGTAGGVGIGISSPVAPFELSSSSSSALSHGLADFFQPNLPAGSTAYLKLGVNYAALYNEADLSFNYTGSASTSNNLGIGFYGEGAVANFYASGIVKVSNLAGTGNRPVSADASGNLRVGSSLGYSSSNKATFTYTTSSGTGASGTPSTGATWTIPSGVTQAFVKLWGAGGGGNSQNNAVGGGGGFISGWLTWPSGTTSLTIIVGGGGGVSGNDGTGAAGTNGGGSSAYAGGGGGGRSCIQVGGTDYVAAGGGGGGCQGANQRGGGAGGGGQGLTGYYTSGGTGQALGGTQTAGGTSGAGNAAASGHVGASHTGGSSYSYGGGGGGGWFGGGAGGSSTANGNDGAGAGGSSGGNSTYFTFVWGEAGQMCLFNTSPDAPTLSGGVGDPDYIYGIGSGGVPTSNNNFPVLAAGNGYVVIYW